MVVEHLVSWSQDWHLYLVITIVLDGLHVSYLFQGVVWDPPDLNLIVMSCQSIPLGSWVKEVNHCSLWFLTFGYVCEASTVLVLLTTEQYVSSLTPVIDWI